MAQHLRLACLCRLCLVQYDKGHNSSFICASSLSLTVVVQGVGHIVSGGILVFAMLYALYSFFVYLFRRRAIESRDVDGHYDDAW